MRRAIVLLLFAAGVAWGQPSHPIDFVQTDPVGACGQAAYIAKNTLTGQETDCLGGVWTPISGTGGGNVSAVDGGPLGSGYCATGGGSTLVQTPSANCTVDSSGNLTAATVGNFTQTGAGAVARTFNSKLGDVVSVKDFGAVDNWDDTAALVSAHDAVCASGGTLVYPPGTSL